MRDRGRNPVRGHVGRLLAFIPIAVVAVAAVVVDALTAVVRDLRNPPAQVIDRSTGERIAEPRPLSEHIQMSLVWSTFIGSRFLCRAGPFLDYLERLTEATGNKMDDPASREQIPRFIADNGVETADLDRDPSTFSTLNEFFARPLRPGARPITKPEQPSRAVAPADCRLRCVAIADDHTLLDTKGHQISVRGILGIDAPVSVGQQRAAQERLTAFYHDAEVGGFAVAVCRLAPGDYHRFHWPVEAEWTAEDAIEIVGRYHSVSPTAMRSVVDVLGVNRRMTLLARSEAFGPVALVAVGALKVASIELTSASGSVRKGDELGLFRYGGSTVVVIFRADAIRFDDDLLAAGAAGYETKVRMGESLGVAPP